MIRLDTEGKEKERRKVSNRGRACQCGSSEIQRCMNRFSFQLSANICELLAGQTIWLNFAKNSVRAAVFFNDISNAVNTIRNSSIDNH